jgi:hypothetical protein
MPRVYVVNKSSHDFSAAYEHGSSLIFITEGRLNHFKMNTLYRKIVECFDSTEIAADDYILQTSLVSMNMLTAAIFAARFGRLNLLIFNAKRNFYIPYNMVLSGGVDG